MNTDVQVNGGDEEMLNHHPITDSRKLLLLFLLLCANCAACGIGGLFWLYAILYHLRHMSKIAQKTDRDKLLWPVALWGLGAVGYGAGVRQAHVIRRFYEGSGLKDAYEKGLSDGELYAGSMVRDPRSVRGVDP